MNLAPSALFEPATRFAAAAQNALEVARFGGLETDEEPADYEVVCERRNYRLRRYLASADAAKGSSRPPVVLVPQQGVPAASSAEGEAFALKPDGRSYGGLTSKAREKLLGG